MRRCLDCTRLVHLGPRCSTCQRARDRRRWQTKRHRYDTAWRATSKQTRDEHLATHGPTCPGYARPAHPATDLVVDHDLGVLCRTCNAVKANTADRGKPAPGEGGSDL